MPKVDDKNESGHKSIENILDLFQDDTNGAKSSSKDTQEI